MAECNQLADFDSDHFLQNYWQKRPFLIRNPWIHWHNPLEPDELAGLACEEGIESRLVTSKGSQLAMENGPLPEARLNEFGSGPATLLVQAVDHYVPAVADLIEPFRFVPDWRIDDVMVSYATDGGGVGAHFDQYDVFLIQGLGRRCWRVGQLCDTQTPLLQHDDLRLLASFVATDEWILEPGDILYVPPGFAHDGIAIGDDCMTYSIGFRAPSRAELIEGWGAHLVDALLMEDRYADPDLTAQAHPGEIAAPAIDQLHTMVLESMTDRDAFARWFGEFTTLPKYTETDWRPEMPISEQAVQAQIDQGRVLIRNPASRFAFVRDRDNANLLFADGHSFHCPHEMARLAELICASPAPLVQAGYARSLPAAVLITALINQGSLAFDDEA